MAYSLVFQDEALLIVSITRNALQTVGDLDKPGVHWKAWEGQGGE